MTKPINGVFFPKWALLLVGASVILAAVICIDLLQRPVREKSIVPQATPTPEKTIQPPANHPPDSVKSTPEPQPDALADARKKNARALLLLGSTNETQQVEGLKLLGAFPSPEGEQILTGYLVGGENPSLRSTAALSLSTLENPSPSTIDALLGTLGDSSEVVRFASLSTLEDYLLLLNNYPALQKQIREGLRTKVGSRLLPPDIHQDIEETLNYW